MLIMDVREALMELAVAIKKIINDRIQRFGVNERIGKNTLEGSDLQKSIQVTAEDDGITLQIADYWEYVALGWKRTHRFQGTFSSFIQNLLVWIRKNNIHQPGIKDNNLAYAIALSIMENGIKARPFMIWNEEGDLTKMLPELDAYMDKWFDHLFDAIMEEIDKYFK